MSEQKNDAGRDAKDTSRGTVDLTIDYGNGAQKRFVAVPLSEGEGVLGVLRAAGAIKPGLVFEFNVTLPSDRAVRKRGFISSIDGVSASESNQKWMMWTNDRFVGDEVSTVGMEAAIPEVNTGDTVTLKLSAG